MRISDWSSDVCSADLQGRSARRLPGKQNRSRPHPGSTRGGTPVQPARLLDIASALRQKGCAPGPRNRARILRSEEHTSELQSLMRISYAVFCLKKKRQHNKQTKL